MHCEHINNSYYEKVVENGKETIRDITAEIPFDIPETWAWTRGFMCFAEMGTCAPSEDYFYYIDIDSIDNKVQAVKSPKKVFTKDAPSRAKRKIHLGDTLFSLVRPYLRNIAYIDTSLKDCIASTGFFVFTPLEFILPEYSYLMILSEYVTMGLNSYMKGDNSPSIRKENIENYLFPIPPQKEQRRIVELQKKFKQSLSLIGEDSFVLKHKIKQTKSKLLDLAIRGKLLPQNPNDEPASALLERIREEQESTKTKRKSVCSYIFKGEDNLYYEQIGSETKCIQDEIPFDIPSTWIWCRLGNISSLLDGNIVSKKSLPYLEAKYLRGKVEATYVNTGKFIHKGETLILVDGENSGEIFHIQEDGYQGSTFRVLKTPNSLCKEYVYMFITKNKQLLKSSKKGSAIPHLNRKIFQELIVPIPPVAEQKRISEFLEMAFKQLDSLIQH